VLQLDVQPALEQLLILAQLADQHILSSELALLVLLAARPAQLTWMESVIVDNVLMVPIGIHPLSSVELAQQDARLAVLLQPPTPALAA
jgi:hypothetical protein